MWDTHVFFDAAPLFLVVSRETTRNAEAFVFLAGGGGGRQRLKQKDAPIVGLTFFRRFSKQRHPFTRLNFSA